MWTVLFCGERAFTEKEIIDHTLRELASQEKQLHLITGGARGADRIAAECARARGILVTEYPADWARYGKAAGPIRNAQMLNEGHPREVFAFFLNRKKSRGTNHMVSLALKQGCVVHIYEHGRGWSDELTNLTVHPTTTE